MDHEPTEKFVQKAQMQMYSYKLDPWNKNSTQAWTNDILKLITALSNIEHTHINQEATIPKYRKSYLKRHARCSPMSLYPLAAGL